MKETIPEAKMIICVDDTDDLTKETSTGKIAEAILQRLQEMGCVVSLGITRHQLLIHEDVNYTSHNSSMCFVAETRGVRVDRIIEAAEKILRQKMAPSADPGLCFCDTGSLKDPEKLIAFGKRAQREVLKKQQAYDTAEEVGGVILREYAGTGEGVIGALAGAGLRLSGFDGIFRGKAGRQTEQQRKTTEEGKTVAERKTAAEWKEELHIKKIYDLEGSEVGDIECIESEGSFKLVLLDHQPALIVKREADGIHPCKKKDLLDGGRKLHACGINCPHFAVDNDVEECLSEEEAACYNCLYRRWTPDGFRCIRESANPL